MDRIEPHLIKPIMDFKSNPHPASADAFLKAVTPIMETGLATYGGKNVNPMMRTRARRVLLSSVSAYDPAKASFKTHAMNQLRTLQRYGAQQQQIIKVPEAVALDQGHLRATENELRDQLGRDPSDMELADRTGISRKRIRYIRAYRPGFAEGQMSTPGGDDEEDVYEPAVQTGDPTHHLAEFLYHDLDPTDQVILEYTVGLNGAPRLPGNLLAQRLKLTPGAISQRKARIEQKLQALSETGIL
jgi:DNA-directed RNA polymerase sigma subunit (sigma70/sigma32)